MFLVGGALGALLLPQRCAPAMRASPRMAEGGPPPIDWQAGTVVSNANVGRGARLLTVRAAAPLAYLPGHVLGLEIEHPETKDPLKGPYTVTRCVDDLFDVLYRVIPDGRKTPFMERLAPGDACRFGGRFGTPIAEGIDAKCDRVVGVATGTGIGPLLGFAEQALEAPGGPNIEFFVGLRDLADAACVPELDALAADSRFSWSACVSRPSPCTAIAAAPLAAPRYSGRVTSAVPGILGSVASTHFHLVGNGAFVKEFKAGLIAGGVSEARVTTEVYFNGKAEPDPDVVAFVSDQLRSEPQTRARAPPR